MKAEMVAEKQSRKIRTVSKAFPFPSVIKLTAYIRMPYKKIELSRKNILRRDNYRCQYCNKKAPDMTIDHVIPRSRGGRDTWENLVAACVKCNNKKGSRTPEEANMPLLTIPKKPHHIMFLKQFIGRLDENWRPFLFMD